MVARVRLAPEHAELLLAHARRDAPLECCGVLIGRIEGELATIEDVRPGRNLSAAHDLYELDPEDFVAADAAAEALGFSVLGFYHSHPRGPDRLSEVDRARAWPAYIYLLICPETRSGSAFSAWVQPASGQVFSPLALE